jgi:predicted ATP-dependent serine protease
MAQTFTLRELLEKQFETYEFNEKITAALGNPEVGFNAIIWGLPGSGKTTFTLTLCKEFMNFGKIYYNAMEQGKSGSLQTACINAGLGDKFYGKIKFVVHTFDEMLADIKKNHCKFLIIDSTNYLGKQGMTYQQYKQLKEFCWKSKKSLILISHAAGKEPKGNYAKQIRYDVDIKIHVENGVAYHDSRYIKCKSIPYVIFEKKKSNSLF